MQDAPDLNCFGICWSKEQSIITDSEPQLVSPGESFYVALTGFRESMQTCQNTHCSRLVKVTDVSPGDICPYNSLHVVFMKRSSSSGVMPRSAKT